MRINVTANIGTYKQNLIFDIGFGDVIVPSPMQLAYPTLLDSMQEPNIMAYSLETVVAEKFQTMIDRGRFNSRMKDYFDLYRIFTVHEFKDDVLAEAIKANFMNRGTEIYEQHDFFSTDFGQDLMLNQQWDNYVRKLKLELPSFVAIHKFITNILSPYWNANLS